MSDIADADDDVLDDVKDHDNIDDDIRASLAELSIEPKQQANIGIDKVTPPRDQTGKFVEAPKTDKAAPQAKDQPKAPVVVADPAAAPAPVAIQVPKGLKPEFKEKFAQLPPEWQGEIARREADAAKVLASQDEERLMGKRVMEMAMPYLPTIRAEGATPEKAFQDYLQTAHVLRSGNDFQKAQAVATVMQQFKVNPQALLSVLQGGSVQSGGGPAQGGFNPQVTALERELADIKGQLHGFTQQRQLEEQRNLHNEVAGFSSKPGHEHFDRVRAHMGILLESGIAEGDTLDAQMEDAYQRAVYADPEIRSTLLAATQQSQTGQRLQAQQAKTERARNAAGSITGAPGSSRPLNGSGSVGTIEDDLRAAYAERRGRV